MARFVIDRCMCSQEAFSSLLARCREQQLDWAQLGRISAAGRLCKHCRPWLQQALLSGQTCFTVDSGELRNGEVLYRHFCPPADEQPATDGAQTAPE